PWMASVPWSSRKVLFQSVKQFQVAPGSTTAAFTCAASSAGTVMVIREPDTLTGIEYSKAGWSVSAGRRSKSTALNAAPSQSASTPNSAPAVCPGGSGNPGGSVESSVFSGKCQANTPPSPGGLGSAPSEPATSTVNVSVSEIVNDAARMSRNAGASCPSEKYASPCGSMTVAVCARAVSAASDTKRAQRPVNNLFIGRILIRQ